ncbi:MAG: alpha/beta fold hydrolase [Eubacteriales bacterium]
MNFKKVISIMLVGVITSGICSIGLDVNAANAKSNAMPELLEYGFKVCNGAKIEYGIYGDMNGDPLLLLPANGGNMHAFDGSILPEMAKHFKVITVSPRGCGNSERGIGKLTFEVMSADLVVLLDSLNIEKTKVFGFSDGANLGIVFTLEHQDRVSKLVAMGANINTFGVKTIDQLGTEIEYRYYCVKTFFTKDKADALHRDIVGMMVGQPNLSFKDISAIKIPVLNIFGENDMFKRWHSKKITKSIEGAKELMVIGGGHSSCFDQTDTVINPALLEFFGIVS